MANYVDLSTLHSPTPRAKPSAAWGAQIRENLEFLHDNRRVVCTSSTRPGTPFEGLEIYETDTDRIYIYDGSTWVLHNVLSQWINYTPTLTQSGTVTKTVAYSRYHKVGRKVTFQAYCSATGSGTGSNIVTLSLPWTAAQASLVVGSFYIYDASVNTNYLGHAALNSVNTVTGLINATSNYMGAAGFTAALASGDSILVDCTYETST